jgi:hypothetical protein
MAGVNALLAWAAWARLGEEASPPAIIWAAAAGGVPLGIVTLLLGGVLLRVAGRILGGTAGAAQVRAALGWTAAPAAFGLGLWAAQLALLPEASFGGGATAMAQQVLAWGCTAIHGGLWLWSAARSVAALAAAHGFSRGRAAASWLLAALIVAAGALGILGGAALIITLRGG